MPRRPFRSLLAPALLAAAPALAAGQDFPPPAPAAGDFPADAPAGVPSPDRGPAPRVFDGDLDPYAEAADPRAFDAPTPLPAVPRDGDLRGLDETPQFGRAEVPGPPRPGVDALPGTPFFADTPYGARPVPGVPGSPSFGLPHRPEQTNRYGIWYRPKSFHAPNRAVYRPSPFRPRGFGNLFDRPCVPDRMDYARYTVRDLPSRYGPAYYPHFRENTECLIRPTRAYDRGPHAENSTGGCRLGGDCYEAGCYEHAAGECGCRKCRGGGRRPFAETLTPVSATACGCPECADGR